MAVQIQLRRGTAANWTASNPTLAMGELGMETDTAKIKMGDGATAWNTLGYFGGAPSGAAGGDLSGTYPNPQIATGTIVTADIGNDQVTYAKMQNVSATDRLLGRDTAAAGDTEELTVGGGIEFTGAVGIQRSALTGDVTAPAGSNATTLAAGSASNLNSGTLPAGRMPALTGDVTTSAGAVATAIANDAVTNAKLANMANATVKGRTTAGTGDPEDLTAAQFMAFVASTNVQVFTTGSGNWSKPAGARFVTVECVGGGGGGGGCVTTIASEGAKAAGGGGGGYARKTLAASALGATEPYAVGAAGAAGAAGLNNGGNGGDSTFGSATPSWGTQVKGSGGVGGGASPNTSAVNRDPGARPGGLGGAATGGDVNSGGEDGGSVTFAASGHPQGGGGGSSVLGGGARTNALGTGLAGHAYGGGGDGGWLSVSSTQVAGGAGAAGVVIVTTYF